MRTLSFHDTVGMPMQQRIDFDRKAKSQEAIVLAFFREHPGQSFSPWGVLNILFGGDMKKLNSVRRAMTNLSDPLRHDRPPLKKTAHKVPGDAGAPNHLWTLNDEA